MSQHTPPSGDAQDPRPDAITDGTTFAAPTPPPLTRAEAGSASGADQDTQTSSQAITTEAIRAEAGATLGADDVGPATQPPTDPAEDRASEQPPKQTPEVRASHPAEHTDEAPPARTRRCETCAAMVEDHAFCEQCGAALRPHGAALTPEQSQSAVGAGRDPSGLLVLGADQASLAPLPEAGIEPEPGSPPCPECGGGFADGYCERCGAPQPDPRAHQEIAPGTWLAGVCDIGVRHAGNQDAMALDVLGTGRAALVVCDGVSSAARSEEASQAAADAALTVLAGATSRGLGIASGIVPAITARLIASADEASEAVARLTGVAAPSDTSSASNPSCTFVAAVIEGDSVVVGSVGDSRAYWLPDEGEAMRLTTDDSWAEEQIRLGALRQDAEKGPQAHTITRWIGIDAPDHTPATTPLVPGGPGWLLLCSDGLWNYASEPQALASVFRAISLNSGDRHPAEDPLEGATDGAAQVQHSPLELARRLVDWANAQGGQDNITVALARLGYPDAFSREDEAENERLIGDEDPLGINPTVVIPEADAGVGSSTLIEQNATHG